MGVYAMVACNWIAYYKCVLLVEGTNIVRRELGLPEARVRAADPRLYFANAAE